MLAGFKHFIEKEKLCGSEEKLLLAVSGGLDSVVMSFLFKQAGFRFGIAHCNFQLRGRDSDEDEQFVKQLAEQLQAPFYSTRFETKNVAKQLKKSIQLAARELRYQWLEEIRKTHGFAAIATAHHLNDSIETILYNFTKGCGIRGLHGIPPKNGAIIRPMLFASRSVIENFAQQHQLTYREDTSNLSVKYMRNKIRHEVIPILRMINPSFEKTVEENIIRLKETEAIFLQAIERIREDLVNQKDELIFIDYKKIPSAGKPTILFELIHPYGFNNDQVRQILEDHATSSGTQFFSDSHRLVIGREHYILSPKVLYQPGELEIHKTTRQLTVLHKTFIFSILKEVPSTFSTNLNEAVLDYEQLKFPLKLRRWKRGDRFQPFGMKGHSQSLQDFFTHQKLSIPEKEKVWILESDGTICWVVGMRIDERYRVTAQTNTCFSIRILS